MLQNNKQRLFLLMFAIFFGGSVVSVLIPEGNNNSFIPNMPDIYFFGPGMVLVFIVGRIHNWFLDNKK